MKNQSDRELYTAACTGDRAAFEALAERHHRYTMQVAASYVSDQSAAEDIAHKAWLNICRHIKRVTDGETKPLTLKYEHSLVSWLKTITSNVARDEFRRRSHFDTSELHDDDVVIEPDFTERLNMAEMRSSVWDAFKLLSERCRELLLLLLKDPPLSYEAVAQILDRPVGSIGPTRARCIDNLRTNLGAA